MVHVDTFSAHALFQSLITDECFAARVALFLLNNVCPKHCVMLCGSCLARSSVDFVHEAVVKQ